MESNWKLYNNFRSGDLSPSDGQAAPDLVLGEANVCEAECVDNLLVLSYHLGNIGASALTAGATVEVFVVIGGVEMAAESFEVVDPLEAGTWLDGYLYELDPTDVEQVIVRVSAKEEECNVENNELVLDGPFCSEP